MEYLFNPLNAVVALGLAGFIGLEALFPARRLPEVRFWRWRGLAATAVYFTIAAYAPFLWASWIGHLQVFDMSGLPIALQVAGGYVAAQTLGYWWHRAMHKSDLLWRVFHQMHHSQERLDSFGAFYFSPLDALGFTFVSGVGLTLVGVEPLAIAIIAVGGAFIAMLTHANLKTPHWLGYLIARPESHALHHGRAHHADNYSELPLVDMIFGTFVNPRERVAETGFYDGASERVLEMLTFRDVSEPPSEPPKRKDGGHDAVRLISALFSVVLTGFAALGVVSAMTPIS